MYLVHVHVADELQTLTINNGTHLRENMKRGVYVDGIIEQVVSTAVEAYKVGVSIELKGCVNWSCLVV